jgi:hypothetical protein
VWRSFVRQVSQIIVAVAPVLWAGAAFAEQAAGDCRVAPDSSTATETADPPSISECGGILQPPRVGDGELVEPPPQVGETPVIRPDELPPQQSGDEGDEKGSAEGYRLEDIVSAISQASEIADRVPEWHVSSPLKLIDISILFQGAARVALDTALQRHREGVTALRQELFERDDLQEKLDALGLDQPAIVAVDRSDDGSLIVFVRHP